MHDGVEHDRGAEKSSAGSHGKGVEEVLMHQAYEKLEREEYAAAASLFEDILRRFAPALEAPQMSVINSELARVFFWLGDYENAEHHAGKAVSFSKDNDHALSILGKIAVARFQFPEARGYFAKISDKNAAKHLGFCLIAIKLRDTKGALEFLRTARSLISPKDPEYCVLAAYCTLLHGDTKEAVSAAREMLKKIKQDPFLLLLIAEIFMTAGNYGEAQATAERVGRTCQENDLVHAIAAHAAYADENYQQAETSAREAIRLNSRNAYAQTVLMKLATRSGNYTLAESIGLAIIERCPEYSLAHANLGDAYFNQGRYELAKIEYEQTQQLMNSNTKGARLRQARMKFIASEYADAAQVLEQLISSHHTYYDDAMCDLALAYDQLGDSENKSRIIDSLEMRKSFYHRTEKLLKKFAM